MDKGKQIVTGKSDAGVSGSTNKKIRALIDRSKLRILLCDTNAGSCKEVASLLKECSYQVISVGSTGEAIHVLSSEGPSIDIVLAELDLPMANCLKMLKYITEDQELRCIPVIMLVTEDKISMIANCLRYGAVDYLLTPLGINELLNLSIHMESKAHAPTSREE
ncbi:two-component response regulator-like APRR1 isoform X2 [Vitis vinifera]|uniref:two-component response regulator-like APRR1 isoform X2 n=1 Tax=Vitis vinifera TaxID=29760 RepID=UPI0001985246|nr:two-component response regulator-like APRR1 isoform X2 [Vitis vinifera]|eukprot:XP_002284703.1 PREDICTED: two-component response regulator-like APRR1 isoform X2 [Vitis vinifera]